MEDRTRVAVLIDCDNISHRWAEPILAEAAKHGTLNIKRAYGDWSSPHVAGWFEQMSGLGLEAIQQSRIKGKNSTDTALVIDAMDLLYSGHVDLFCIVSSDGDFTRLATRLRRNGLRVFGIGERKTPEAFRNACDRFTFVEVLIGERLPVAPPDAASVGLPGSQPQVEVVTGLVNEPEGVSLPSLVDVFSPAVRTHARDDGWALLSSVGWYIVNNNSSFDARNYGFERLGLLAKSLDFLEVASLPDASGSPQTWVRLRRPT